MENGTEKEDLRKGEKAGKKEDFVRKRRIGSKDNRICVGVEMRIRKRKG